MKTLWHSLWILLVAWPCAAAERDRITVRARLNADSSVIEGVAEIRFHPRSVPLSDLRFRLYPNLFANDSTPCGITVDSLWVNGADLSARMVTDTTDLWVSLPDPIPADSNVAANLKFHAVVPSRGDRFSLYDRQYTLEAWFPYPAPWDSDHWQRVSYRSFLEPAANLSDIDVEFTYPDSLHLIAAGLQRLDTASGLATAVLGLQDAVDLPLLLTGDQFLLDSTRHGDVNVRIYSREADAFMVETVRDAVAVTLDSMAAQVLPYPFGELTIVIGGLTSEGGLEMPRMALLGRPAHASIDHTYEITAIHEVIHQWFYGLLAGNQADYPWLDEAVTQYFSKLVGESYFGERKDFLEAFGLTAGSIAWERMAARPHFDLQPITRPGQAYYDDAEYIGTIYNKGPLVISTLTGLMGQENSRRFWQEYSATCAFGSPTPEDFVRLADKYLPMNSAGGARAILACNVPLDWQLNQLSNELVSDSAADTLTAGATPRQVFTVRVEYTAIHPIGFPVTFRVTMYDGTFKDTVLVPEPGRHEIEIMTTGPARSAEIDPDNVYAVDVNLLNNSFDNTGSRGVALRLFSRLTQAVETLFSTLWGW